MFSGIVECIGIIKLVDMIKGCKQFSIQLNRTWPDLKIGDSVSVNGVCLSVTAFTADTFNVAVVPETLSRTTLSKAVAGDKVNLELAIKGSDRIGGHYVQGHVDTVGHILSIDKHQHSDALLAKISIPHEYAKYIVAKGYIALDGMSLTVIDAATDWFTVTFIPHTQEVTITHLYETGKSLNIEVDMMGKYIEKLLGAHLHARTH